MNTITLISTALGFSFFQRAIIIGSLLAIICAILGNFVVLRKEANISHSISHFAFLGVSLALFWNANINIFIVISVLIGIIFITILNHSRWFSKDSVIELTAQLSIAIAIVIISILPGYQPNILQYLFGNILAITQNDMWFSLGLGGIVIIFYIIFRRKLLQVIFSNELAKSIQTPTLLIEFLYLSLIGLTIAIGVKIIGIILIGSFLIIPTNTAKMIANNFKQLTIYSLIFAILGVNIGLFISYIFDIPSGATIILTMLTFFSVIFIIKKIQK